MKSFEFKDHKEVGIEDTIIIDGKVFTLNVTSLKTLTALDDYNSKRESIYKKAEKSKDNNEKFGEVILNHYKLIVETVDRMLGEGSFHKIFENRDINYKDSVDVMEYILECITDIANKAKEEYEHPAN